MGKCEKVIIPEVIVSNWNLAKHTIRGIIDTDGSVFGADKPGSASYPSIETTTSSIKLAIQIKGILQSRGFRVANIWKYKSRNSKISSYKIPLNGYWNLEKWLNEISFSNPRKLHKAQLLLKIKKHSKS